MEFNAIFRKILEQQGVDYLLSNRSANYLADAVATDSKNMIYIWRAMLRDGLIKEFINSTGSDEIVNQMAYKYSIRTGFEFAKIQNLLKSFSLGVRQSFWGVEPRSCKESLLFSFDKNKEKWNLRKLLFKDGIFRIKTKGLYGFITLDGKTVIEPKYLSAGVFNEGLVCVADSDGNFYFLNILGNKELELNIQEKVSGTEGEVGLMSKDYAVYTYNHKYGLITKEGHIIPPIYDYIEPDQDSPIVAYLDGKDGLIEKSTLSEISPFKYSKIQPFRNSLQLFTVATTEAGRQVFLNRSGEQFEDNKDDAESKSNYYFIDNIVLELDNNGRLSVLDSGLNRNDYHYGCVIDDRFGHILNRTIVDIPYSPVLYFRRRYGYYASGMGYVFIGTNGKVLNEKVYSLAHQFNNGFAWVKQGCKWYRINIQGETLNAISGFEVLSPEYNNSVLARNNVSGMMVLVSYTGEVLFTFPDSENSDLTMTGHYQYIIATPHNDFVWYNGILTKVEGKISNKMLLWTHYVLLPKEDNKLKIYDLKDGTSHIFQLKGKNDRVFHLPAYSKLKRGLICCKTPENKTYLVDVKTNNTSDDFDEFQIFSPFPIGRKEGKDYLLGEDLKIAQHFDQIISGQQNYGNV